MADVVSNTPLIAFTRGLATDTAGRRIDEIWGWDNRRLEMVHDYIQWLFPLPEASRFNPDAPQLTRAEAEAFRDEADLRDRVLRSLDVMLRFYGLQRGASAVTRAADFAERAALWLTPLNHNHLRLTRMLLSLGYLGHAAAAAALLACLQDIAAHEGQRAISARARAFWNDAIQTPPPL